MGRLIEQQAVIDCLTTTAKYFDMPQADEWTKGIHYGLIHGLDNILDNVPTVEAIPKMEYEAKLKADMLSMLYKLRSEIINMPKYFPYADHTRMFIDGDVVLGLIDNKIDALRENEDGKID